MRKDLSKPTIKSSFLSCEKDTETILKKLFIESRPHSDVLKKLLIINTKDCLTSNNLNYINKINSMNLSDLREQQYIRLNPKARFFEHEEVKGYIFLTFDNFVPNFANPEYRDCNVIFQIICHSDYWDLNDYQIRPLKIVGFIDGILNNTKLSGIGTLNFLSCNKTVLNEDLSGYTLIYRAVHDVNGDDKIPSKE